MISTPSPFPFTSLLNPPSRILQRSLGLLTFSCLSASVSFCKKKKKNLLLSAHTHSRMAPKTGQWELLKGVSWQNDWVIFPKHFSLGTGWTIIYFFKYEPFWVFLYKNIADMTLQYQVYTNNVYTADQERDGALIKYRTELHLSASGNRHPWLICHIISFVHSTGLGLLKLIKIDRNS